MNEIEQLLVGLILVGLGLTLKVLRDGLREIAKLQGVIAYTDEEAARFEKERVEAESEAEIVRESVHHAQQEVASLELRATTMRGVVAKKKAEIEKEKQNAKARLGL